MCSAPLAGPVILRELLRRLGLGWLALELSAAVLAASILVMLLPAVLVLITRPELPWLALASVLPVSVPLGGILAYHGLRLGADLLHSARPP
jgi:hypothetical protein